MVETTGNLQEIDPEINDVFWGLKIKITANKINVTTIIAKKSSIKVNAFFKEKLLGKWKLVKGKRKLVKKTENRS
ncbi:hypothetical protein A2V71_04260 [Candidatus Berkelbacteria bacterium RBG_13_40_8]|uniref:Uncharacterized protein n=1 Tax=Candidatus Berkelbacteria bacterium RBG_13_40_8 TaxID=1797467 RepID=A0A1F5DNI0_9BACT|nr:MAG: hypothetical protein A2V71_04260 [Candidatus Berkelbacteria bacterium RBG_13_40_8]